LSLVPRTWLLLKANKSFFPPFYQAGGKRENSGARICFSISCRSFLGENSSVNFADLTKKSLGNHLTISPFELV
jgi:hypothetical protein